MLDIEIVHGILSNFLLWHFKYLKMSRHVFMHAYINTDLRFCQDKVVFKLQDYFQSFCSTHIFKAIGDR